MRKSSLDQIVVEISRDGKTGCGTGFYISSHSIATCYHVLARQNENVQSCYYIRHDNWESWVEAEPLLQSCFPPARDVAILNISRTLPNRLGFTPANWVGEPTQFKSKGYDQKKKVYGVGATTIEGDLVGFTTYKGYPRLQLRTLKGTIDPGRSGSPVWSIQQQTVVGMIDWLGETLEAEPYELVLAIPIEHVLYQERKQEDVVNCKKDISKDNHDFYNGVCKKCGCNRQAFEIYDWPCRPK